MRDDPAEVAAYALANLTMFHALVRLTESSLISSEFEPALERIRKICNGEAQKCLRKYDKARAALAGQQEGEP